MIFNAKEKDNLLKYLDSPNYMQIETNKDVEIAKLLRKDGYINLIDSFEIAARITKSGKIFLEKGGYSIEEDINIEKENRSKEIDRLQKENLLLANKELKHQRRIRIWKVIACILTIFCSIMGIIIAYLSL